MSILKKRYWLSAAKKEVEHPAETQVNSMEMYFLEQSSETNNDLGDVICRGPALMVTGSSHIKLLPKLLLFAVGALQVE